MSQSTSGKIFSTTLQQTAQNVKPCYFECFSVFIPFIILVVLIDLFFWDNIPVINYLFKKSEILFYTVDYVIYGVLLAFLMFLCLTIIKTVRLANDEGVKGAANKALRVVWSRLGSLVLTGVLVLVKTVLFGLLFIIPGLIYNFLCGFALIINIVEEKDAKTSVKESVGLIKANWKTYLSSTVLLVMYWVMLSYPIVLLFNTLGSIVSARGYFLLDNAFNYIALGYVFFISVGAIEFFYQLYNSLKNNK